MIDRWQKVQINKICLAYTIEDVFVQYCTHLKYFVHSDYICWVKMYFLYKKR